MKRIFTIILLCLITPIWGQAIVNSEDEIRLKIEQTLLPPFSHGTDSSWITNENRNQVFEILLGMMKIPENITTSYIEEALVKSSHEETIKGLVEKMKDPVFSHRALFVATEIAIQHAMPMVYSGSTEDPNKYGTHGWDVVFTSVRERAISFVLSCIARSNEFPRKTKEWAEKMMSEEIRDKDENYVNFITSWWEKNQTAVLEKRYVDAAWLPNYPEELSALVQKEPSTEKTSNDSKRFRWIAGTGLFLKNVISSTLPWIILVTSAFLVFFFFLKKKI